MENDARYQTLGQLYYVTGSGGERAILALPEDEYYKIMAIGIEDEEVELSLTKANYGSEYHQTVPTHRMRAGIYTIMIDGVNPRFQLDIAASDARALRDRGFRDGEEAEAVIGKLPYRTKKQADYRDLSFDLDEKLVSRIFSAENAGRRQF